MNDNTVFVFEKAPVPKAVLKNAIPAMAAMLMVLIYNLADTWEPARTYLTVVALGGPFVLISNCYSNILRAEGQPNRAMIGQVLGNLLNVILDLPASGVSSLYQASFKGNRTEISVPPLALLSNLIAAW